MTNGEAALVEMWAPSDTVQRRRAAHGLVHVQHSEVRRHAQPMAPTTAGGRPREKIRQGIKAN